MLKVVFFMSALVLSVSAFAAPAVESYLPALESLSSANDQRGSVFKATIVKVIDISSKQNSVSQVIEVNVLAKEDEKSKPYAMDVYLLTVGDYATLKNIQFVERILLNK
jgi:hypothetical protein